MASIVSKDSQEPGSKFAPGAMVHCHGPRVLSDYNPTAPNARMNCMHPPCWIPLHSRGQQSSFFCIFSFPFKDTLSLLPLRHHILCTCESSADSAKTYIVIQEVSPEDKALYFLKALRWPLWCCPGAPQIARVWILFSSFTSEYLEEWVQCSKFTS